MTGEVKEEGCSLCVVFGREITWVKEAQLLQPLDLIGGPTGTRTPDKRIMSPLL